MINVIQEGMGKVVVSMKAGVERVVEGVVMLQQVGVLIVQVCEGLVQVVMVINEIFVVLREQLFVSSEMVKSVECIVQMSEFNSEVVELVV